MKFSLQIACPPDPTLPTRKDFRAALALFDAQDEICIRIVSPEESRQLNHDFRQQNHPTNVLSFPFLEPLHHTPKRYLGDLALCHQVIVEEAQAQGKPVLNHYQHLLIHGILHLLGLDHDTDSDANEMEAIEIQYLSQLKISNPYEGHAI